MKKVLAAVLMVLACVAYAETDYTVERKVDYLWRHFVGSGGGGSVLQRLAEAEHDIHGIAGGLATNAEEIAQLETRIDGIATNYLPAWYRRSGPHDPWSPSWIVSEDVRFFGSVCAPELTQPLEDGIATNAAAIAAMADSVDSLDSSVSELSDEVSAVSEQATAVGADLGTHTGDTDNPHNVTLEQAATAGGDATYDYMRDNWGVEVDPSSGVVGLSGFGRAISFEEGYLDGEFDFRERPTYLGVGLVTDNEMPTDVSVFDNDAGYITSADVPTDVSAFNNDAGYITSADVPTDVSDFNNDAGYATSNAVSEIARYIVNEMAADGWEVDGTYYKLVVQPFVPPLPATTTLKLSDGTEEVVDISGTLDQQWFTDHGYFVPDRGWEKELTQVIVGTNVTSIGEQAILNCESLTNVTILGNVTSIGNDAFVSCFGLASVTIPDSVTSIGSGAFSYCEDLANITIPDSVTGIGDSAFLGCSGLTNVTILGTVTNDWSGSLFSYCTRLTTITLGGKMTKIGKNMCKNCTSLASVTIGDSVTSIGQFAFWGCSGLTSMAIPDSTADIGAYAFYGCSGLTSVTMSGKTIAAVQAMSNYPWQLPSGCVVTCSDGTITIP